MVAQESLVSPIRSRPRQVLPADQIAELLPPALAGHFMALTDGCEKMSGADIQCALNASLRLWARDMSRFFRDVAYAEGDLPC